MNIVIEKATTQDLDGIEKIEVHLEHRILSSDTLSSTLNEDTYYYFVAKNNNIVVGYLSAQLLVDHFDILAIAVSQDFRRQNIATCLLDALSNVCVELKIMDIFLEVRQHNLSAIAFYEKSNFEKIDIRKRYYADTGEDAYIYTKRV